MSGCSPHTPHPIPALNLLRRLLLLPLLAPLLAVLLLAALNPRPLVSVRLLTSRSPALPMGVWLAAGGGAGALLSSLATCLALLEGGRRSRNRAVPPPRQAAEPWSVPGWPRGRPEPPEPEARRQTAAMDDGLQAGPERGPGEPPPTVSVPFKVLRGPQRATPSSRPAAPTQPTGARTTAAAAEGQAADDWDRPADEDW